MACCQNSSACHEATSSSRSGSVPPWTAAAASTAYWSIAFCRPRKVHPGSNPSRSPSRGGGSAGLALHHSSASPARRRNTSPGNVSLRGAGMQARPAPRRCQRRGRARRAACDARSSRPQPSAASCRACHDGRPEPSIAGCRSGADGAARRDPRSCHAGSLPSELSDVPEPPFGVGIGWIVDGRRATQIWVIGAAARPGNRIRGRGCWR